MVKVIVGAVIALGLLAGSAWAQMAEVSPACVADVKKFCTAVKPGQGKMTECLKKNEEQLTPECKITVAAGRANIPPSPCKTDIERLCPTIEPGNGAIAACLRQSQNVMMLNAGCKVYLSRIKD
ncbi:Cysteine rich repeat-containing protein [uncultured Gammaproteobacteria bacterium]